MSENEIYITTISSLTLIIILTIWNHNSNNYLSKYVSKLDIKNEKLETNRKKKYELVKNKNSKLEDNDWIEHKIAGPGQIIKVSWDQKYGITKTTYCKIVFSNKTQKTYKLIAPWITNEFIIERNNIYNISTTKYPKIQNK